jgi:hypothetical protein
MIVVPNQMFKHGSETYEAGESYDVSDDDAQYFQQAGWIGGRTAGEDVTLEVADIQLGHSAEVN